MSYKRLGDYIQLVDNRNKDLKVTNLLGISDQFRPGRTFEIIDIRLTGANKFGQFLRVIHGKIDWHLGILWSRFDC